MAKIMLVEDDDNLREIYGARLQAEGYDVVSAKDGEEALALAVKEKPDLIISDVMMPRISGFDMLDILHNAPETKNTKVIMMTALSQAEDKARADKLGADRYLVKSQVTLEDVTNVVKEVLGGNTSTGTTETDSKEQATTSPAATAPAATQPASTPPAVTPAAAPEATTATTEPAAAPVSTEKPKEPETPALPTVEAIANPVVEVHDDATDDVQAPPANLEFSDQPAATPTSQPQAATTQSAPDPGPVVTQPAATTPPSSDDKSAASVSTTDDAGLPPIVEPAQPVAIKVELPDPVDEPATDPTPAATDDKKTDTKPSEDEKTAVGPSVDEALATEAKDSSAAANDPLTEAKPDIPVVSNGTPTTIVVEPTQTPLTPPADEVKETPNTEPPKNTVIPVKTEDADTMSGVSEIAGKKVIKPITDPLAKPDLNALLEAEERKAAVQNPVANTVITPGQVAQDTSTEAAAAPAIKSVANGTAATTQPAASPQADELNNIAL